MPTITTSASKELKQTCLRILFLCICPVDRFFLEFLLYLFRLRRFLFERIIIIDIIVGGSDRVFWIRKYLSISFRACKCACKFFLKKKKKKQDSCGYIIKIFMENRGNRRLHLRSSESNFGAWKHVYSLPSFLFFFFFYFLILVSLYIFGRAKTLQNRSFNIDTAGYKTIWSTDSLKIKKRHCEGNSPISQIL